MTPERRKRIQIHHARAVLANCNIPLGGDYHTLSDSKVQNLLSWADNDRYRKPKNANGSRARYYHDMLQRRAAAQAEVVTMPKLDPTPEVSGKYGAPMGRASHPHEFSEYQHTVLPDAPPMYLVRCPLDSGGYDRGGAYWGLGAPLYYYEAHLTDIRGYVRGKTRGEAKEQVKKIHPHARFFR